MKIGIVVPHIFMHRDILPHVIFAPGKLAITLADGLQTLGNEVHLFTPGPVRTEANNITADLTTFQQELAERGDSYIDLLKKHPLTFISLARQVQSELIAKAYEMANHNELDIVHIYTNEEDIALPFAAFCKKPVVFTHHDPFNFLTKYRHVFPKYRHYPWISISIAQRNGMPKGTNWVANIYHGIDKDAYRPNYRPKDDYVAYIGRIIKPKGLHLAIQALRLYNANNNQHLKLLVAGKHYAGHKKDSYWKEFIEPELQNTDIEYIGFISDPPDKQQFISNARALLVPSTFEEPFGMVLIEALACATPVIGLDSGAISEIIKHGVTGFVVSKTTVKEKGLNNYHIELDNDATARSISEAMAKIHTINRKRCRIDFEERFTSQQMCSDHLETYSMLTK